MDSSDENPGLALLRKWQTTEKLIRATFQTAVTSEFAFIAVGKIEGAIGAELHIAGKDFDFTCDLTVGSFEHVVSEEFMREFSPSLIGREPESLDIVFSWNERLQLTVPSKLLS
jgi:hypothetical protein